MKNLLFTLIMALFMASTVHASQTIDPTVQTAVIEDAAIMLNESEAVLQNEVNAGSSEIIQEGSNVYRLVRADGSGVLVILEDWS